ncbi:cytochrome c551 [Halobacillus sp. Marseille-Q1614]|uniref:cytochrome c551 n=1 Tax=Halobacillus sp. Marseille-Q1614 TaxID=2709134 RepID=UPI00156F8350|nr:cytochrome c [Halobacillus sp. Marseille-Q1614]
MKKWLLTLLFGGTLVLSACGGGGDEGAEESDGGGDTGGEETTSEEVDVAAAEQVYEQNCASCHGGDMEGNVGPALTDVGSNYSPEEISQIIQEGKGSMPAQNVQPEEADNVAKWLTSME